MQSIGLIFFLASVVYALPSDIVKIRDLRHVPNQKFIESIRKIILNGDPERNLPPLDPLNIVEYNLELQGTLFRIAVDIKNGRFMGAADFILHTLRLNSKLLTIDYDIEIPHSVITSEYYKMTGDIYTAIPVYGEGKTHLEVQNLRMVGVARLAVKHNTVAIERMDEAIFSVKSVKSDSSGFIGGGDIDNVVNAIINDVAADYVTRFSASISQLTTPVIASILNRELRKYTLKELENMLV